MAFFMCFLGWAMGFEPTTLGITIRYSNQLNYAHHCTANYSSSGAPDWNRTNNLRLRRPLLYPVELRAPYGNALLWVLQLRIKWSGRWDSNSRPPGPKPGAITGLRYAPTSCELYVMMCVASRLLCEERRLNQSL